MKLIVEKNMDLLIFMNKADMIEDGVGEDTVSWGGEKLMVFPWHFLTMIGLMCRGAKLRHIFL